MPKSEADFKVFLVNQPALADEIFDWFRNDLEVNGRYECPLATLTTRKMAIVGQSETALAHTHKPTNEHSRNGCPYRES